MSPGSLFEFTSRYIPVEVVQKLLPVYALRQTISSIPSTAMDDSVKWAKLKWWSDELTAEAASASRHPILRALYDSGARKNLDDALLQRLVNNAAMQVDAFPDADKSMLFTRCAVLGETDIQLEMALDDSRVGEMEMQLLSRATGLYALIVDWLSESEQKTIQLPLDLQAQFQLADQTLKKHPAEPGLVSSIAVLIDDAVEAFEGAGFGPGKLVISGRGVHLQLRWAVEARRLTQLKKNLAAMFHNIPSFGPSDAWFAWRFSRQLRQR